MSVLSLPTTGHTQVYVSGDVMIDETATIAPGVILQATANSRIIIRAGVCIGMGTVITASDGSIEVGEGAILGAGVLLVGYGKIGDRACIGTASTLINTTIGKGELVTPGSLLGDSSRQEDLQETEPKESVNSDDPWSDSQPPVMESNGEVNGKVNDHLAENNGHAESPAFSEFSSETNPSSNGDRPEETAKEEKTDPPTSPSQQQSPTNSTIYGQTHIERLMVTLFPHKEQFKKDNK